MSTAERRPANVSLEEFEAIFESVKNWGRWGDDDIRGTLNLLTPEHVKRAAGLVKSGRHVSMAIPINTTAGPDNPNPAIHHMTQMHDSGRSVDTVMSKGAQMLDMDDYATGVVGRGVLYDVPRHRGVKRLEPGEAVARAELEENEEAQGVRVEEGDIFVFRTGHHRRRLELGAWDNGYDGEGKAGLHVDTIPWMHERGVAVFMPDGDGETVPGTVDGLLYPIHPLQVTAMGMLVSDSLQLEDVARACEEEGRWEFLVTCSPLRIRGGTGSPFNQIAVL